MAEMVNVRTSIGDTASLMHTYWNWEIIYPTLGYLFVPHDDSMVTMREAWRGWMHMKLMNWRMHDRYQL